MKHLLRCVMSLTCHVSDTRDVLLKIRQSLGQQDTIKTHFSQIENWQCANKTSLSIPVFFPRSLQKVAAYSQGSSQLGCLTSATTWVPWRTGWPCRTNILQCSTALWTCTPSPSLRTQPTSGETYWTWQPACWLVALTQREQYSSSSLRCAGEEWWMSAVFHSD